MGGLERGIDGGNTVIHQVISCFNPPSLGSCLPQVKERRKSD
jgi:hypothetical protein